MNWIPKPREYVHSNQICKTEEIKTEGHTDQIGDLHPAQLKYKCKGTY